MRWILLISAALVVVLIWVEVGLRSRFGFGDPLLYVADDEIGYLLAPNQTVRRFGNRISINQYSMRSAAIVERTAERSPSVRVLMVGDSIVNGGWWTDQPEVLSEQVARQWDGIEVLNASANSWGPRNELAYLKRFGCFEAQAIVLVINTDDLFATTPSPLVVGRDRNYPDRKPLLALIEVVQRYLLPAPKLPEAWQKIQKEGGDRVGANLEAIRQIQAIATQANARFLLLLTPLLREVGQPGSREYEIVARQRLLALAQANQSSYIDVLPLFNQASDPKALYRDHIHLSPLGNSLLSAQISQWMSQWINQ
ncbi:SGNH/GDSL hydrolase family protein [Myxacorys almedinensis]|uniref:SGNH/GDSL hydrolase family protein n=1 Tax=Myxacorys almedinensis A TaxID=2690445 RepID=A0A8J7Z0E8_9CYAN|nr:SGNH/GDSL hydrolase family protein [Myxacorys almedinensis]NDJ17849.1 SGNH/GDSL hydrolase family protein [Myxacorys almedinensis A]